MIIMKKALSIAAVMLAAVFMPAGTICGIPSAAVSVSAEETALTEICGSMIPKDTKELCIVTREYAEEFDIPSDAVLAKGYDISSLEELTELESVTICGNVKSLKPLTKLGKLEKLTLSHCYANDYSPLAELKNLKELKLEAMWTSRIAGCLNFGDYAYLRGSLKYISELTQLESLTMTECRLASTDFLDPLKNLRYLDLHGNVLENFTGAKDLKELEYVDISSNNIKSFVGLSGKNKLRSLNISNNPTDLAAGLNKKILSSRTSLCSLDISRTKIDDFSFLKELTGLTEFKAGHITTDKKPKNIGYISYLRKLESIDISSDNLGNNDLSLSLSNLDDLKDIDISGNAVSDFAAPKHLRYLNIEDTDISDISKLSDTEDLEELYLGKHLGKNVTDLSPLKDLRKLKKIYASGNEISDISALKDITSLEEIVLYRCLVEDISPLAGLTNLKALCLGNSGIYHSWSCWFYVGYCKLERRNNISDISALKDLTKLEKLDIAYNNITDISVLENLTELEYLNLAYNNISDITPLKDLRSLKHVNLERNSISDTAPLSRLTSAEKLMLSHNEIYDIKPLSSMRSLKYLYLSYNHITDISPLTTLENVREVEVAYNEITDISPIWELTKKSLTDADVDGNNISQDEEDRLYNYLYW